MLGFNGRRGFHISEFLGPCSSAEYLFFLLCLPTHIPVLLQRLLERPFFSFVLLFSCGGGVDGRLPEVWQSDLRVEVSGLFCFFVSCGWLFDVFPVFDIESVSWNAE